jgi:hypothetical protein
MSAASTEQRQHEVGNFIDGVSLLLFFADFLVVEGILAPSIPLSETVRSKDVSGTFPEKGMEVSYH